MLPLHNAIEHEDILSVSRLLENGADPNQPDMEIGGFRPLHLSIDIECESACRRYDLGEVDARPLSHITKLLLDAGANPSLPDSLGVTPLELAHELNYDEALSLLLQTRLDAI